MSGVGYRGSVGRTLGLWLHDGETVRAAAWGYSTVVGGALGMAQGRIAAITDDHLYVFRSSYWRPTKAMELITRHPIGAAPVSLNGWVLRIGMERMVVHLHHRGRARELASLAERWSPLAVASREQGHW